MQAGMIADSGDNMTENVQIDAAESAFWETPARKLDRWKKIELGAHKAKNLWRKQSYATGLFFGV